MSSRTRSASIATRASVLPAPLAPPAACVRLSRAACRSSRCRRSSLRASSAASSFCAASHTAYVCSSTTRASWKEEKLSPQRPLPSPPLTAGHSKRPLERRSAARSAGDACVHKTRGEGRKEISEPGEHCMAMLNAAQAHPAPCSADTVDDARWASTLQAPYVACNSSRAGRHDSGEAFPLPSAPSAPPPRRAPPRTFCLRYPAQQSAQSACPAPQETRASPAARPQKQTTHEREGAIPAPSRRSCRRDTPPPNHRHVVPPPLLPPRAFVWFARGTRAPLFATCEVTSGIDWPLRRSHLGKRLRARLRSLRSRGPSWRTVHA